MADSIKQVGRSKYASVAKSGLSTDHSSVRVYAVKPA
jgi:hypothetical protein